MSLISKIEKIAPPALKKVPEVALAYLHGSALEGRRTPLSDVDIAIVIEPGAKKGSLELDLEAGAALQDALPGIDIDIHAMNDAPLDFQGAVITNGKLIYSKDNLFRADYEERIRMLYFDFKAFIDQYCEERLKLAIEKGVSYG